MKKNILIRCDASKAIGLGHVTRCLVLANNFKSRGHNVFFAMKNYSLGIDKVKENGFTILLAPEKNFNYNYWIQELVDKKEIDIFIGDIRDGFPVDTIKELKKKNILTIAIDEPSEYAKECDLCFYPPHAKIDKQQYHGQVFQGFEYVLLREQFYIKHKKTINKIPNVLVMMGGTDIYNLTLKILKKLLSLRNNNFNILVIIHEEHNDYFKIKKLDKKIKVFSNVKNMAEFLTKIDFGIISFGMTAYELLTMNIPAIHICLNEEHWKSSEKFTQNNIATRIRKEEIKDIKIKHFNFNKGFNLQLKKNNIMEIILNFKNKKVYEKKII